MTSPPLTKTRIALAFTVAAFADALQIPIHMLESNAIIEYLGIPVHYIGIPIDLFAATVAIILIGFHPALLPSFIVKFVPAVAGLPTWTAAVGYVVWSRRHAAASAPTPNAEPAKPEPTNPPINPKPAPSGLWILAIGAILIIAFIWSRHAPAQRVVSRPAFVSAAAATPAPAQPAMILPRPNAHQKMVVAVGPMENLSSLNNNTTANTATGIGQPRDFQSRQTAPRNPATNLNAEAVCSSLEDQLGQIEGVEILGKQQMRVLRSQISDKTDGVPESVKSARLRNLLPAHIIVLLCLKVL